MRFCLTYTPHASSVDDLSRARRESRVESREVCETGADRRATVRCAGSAAELAGALQADTMMRDATRSAAIAGKQRDVRSRSQTHLARPTHAPALRARTF